MSRYEDFDHFVWAIQQKFDYPLPPGVTLGMPADCRNEADAVTEIIATLKAQRSQIFNEIYKYRMPGRAGG